MSDARSVGRIVKVAGPVVDVEFPPDGMPEILHAITIDLFSCLSFAWFGVRLRQLSVAR